jgi:hypothetical protein
MAKTASSRRADFSNRKSASRTDYDCLKEMLGIAKRNGWDIESLGLVRRDLPVEEPLKLTKRQSQERNRLIRSILKKYAQILTPPVPADLESAIRSRDEETWLPWEMEAIEKADTWREEVRKIKPEILDQLHRHWNRAPST